jgi:hypothetical protein
MCVSILWGTFAISGVESANTASTQDALKKACIDATISAINLEISRSQPGEATEKLQAELEKYQNMNVAEYQLPEKIIETAWVDKKAATGSILYVEGMSKSGPWYHLTGIVDGDYSQLKPGVKYVVEYYKVRPRAYWHMPSSYVYVADIRMTPSASGWDGKGRFNKVEISGCCTVTSEVNLDQYWQISYGGNNKPTHSIIDSQILLDKAWGELRIAPEKPVVNFNEAVLVIIQPGQSITQYQYNVSISENASEIKISLQEYHTNKDRGFLISQEPILAFKLPKSNKPINVEINRAPGSSGPYPK